MIRVYSANFIKSDYKIIGKILETGLSSVCSNDHCIENGFCDDCHYKRVCRAVCNAIEYCDMQSEQMVES